MPSAIRIRVAALQRNPIRSCGGMVRPNKTDFGEITSPTNIHQMGKVIGSRVTFEPRPLRLRERPTRPRLSVALLLLEAGLNMRKMVASNGLVPFTVTAVTTTVSVASASRVRPPVTVDLPG